MLQAPNLQIAQKSASTATDVRKIITWFLRYKNNINNKKLINSTKDFGPKQYMNQSFEIFKIIKKDMNNKQSNTDYKLDKIAREVI